VSAGADAGRQTSGLLDSNQATFWSIVADDSNVNSSRAPFRRPILRSIGLIAQLSFSGVACGRTTCLETGTCTHPGDAGPKIDSSMVPQPTGDASIAASATDGSLPADAGTAPTPTGTGAALVPSSAMTPTTPPATVPVPSGMTAAPPAADCAFTISAGVSQEISTVGIVSWSVTGTTVTSATIEFGQAGRDTLVAPVDTSAVGGKFRTLLLGMKGDSAYNFRINVNDGECTSKDTAIMTGSVPSNLPRVAFDTATAGGTALTKGFYVVSGGQGNFSGVPVAFIFDQDGDPVWWTTAAPPNTSRAGLDYEGNYFYMVSISGGAVRVEMDGYGQRPIPELSGGHHDFTASPGGITMIVHSGDCDAIVEYNSTTKMANTLIPNVDALYVPDPVSGRGCHANSISYIKGDDAFVVGDLYPNMFVKFNRQGEPLWQIGGGNPKGPALAGSGDELIWDGSHGHHLTGDGKKFFLFNNAFGQAARVLEFDIDQTAFTAKLVQNFTLGNVASTILGDAQQLPNGNVLVTYSVTGVIAEFSPTGSLLTKVTVGDSLGYAMHRDSLYGPPPK
jgi:Arylsulfotransferase (ASST)